MIPKVIQVNPQKDYTVYVYFEDGKIVLYDAKAILGKGVFRQLQDKRLFMESCTVMNDTLAWDISGKRDPSDCRILIPRHCMIFHLQKKKIA